MNKPKILYVDDDHENLIVFESGFAYDFEIEITSDISKVHDIIKTNSFEIILLDYKMPAMTGIELADQLYESFPDLIYIITSAYAEMDLVIEAINHHKIYGFIPKPWSFNEVALLLNNAAKFHKTQIENKNLLLELKRKNEQLEKAIENEKNASNLKTTFLKNISHEIRTPLNAIIGFNQIAIKNVTDDKTKSALNHSLTGCYDLLQVITNIVTSSKLISQQMKYHIRSVNIYEIIENILSNKRLNSELKIVNELQKELFLDTDPNALLEIIEVIIDNALKFVRKGEVRIYNKAKNGNIEIHFKDDGPGIDKNALSFIFEPFRQEDETDSRAYGGTGLGLFIAQKHIENLNGHFNLVSEKGKGADFVITFPKKYFTEDY
ncbi:MAG: hypothetical protein C0599_07175 [Salinivirgaceae bacterium]|nr:MAG: hypothetical protein C0599_07175 [Salinivirgaceae bacterium]